MELIYDSLWRVILLDFGGFLSDYCAHLDLLLLVRFLRPWQSIGMHVADDFGPSLDSGASLIISCF